MTQKILEAGRRCESRLCMSWQLFRGLIPVERRRAREGSALRFLVLRLFLPSVHQVVLAATIEPLRHCDFEAVHLDLRFRQPGDAKFG